MIKIDKDKYGPDIRYTSQPCAGLLTWKVAENEVLKAFTANPATFRNGTYQFPTLYKSEKYRDALKKCQGPKCCYCEKPISGGQIEHFRPKKAWQQNKGIALTRPGYYWLAYRWDNLLISCGECNQSGRKGNRFPINGIRATNQKSNLNAEEKILINPAKEEPSQFISFNQDIPVGVDPNGRGDENIKIFELKNRGDIKPIRRERYELYQVMRDIANFPNPVAHITQDKIDRAKNHLRIAQKKKQPFSGMIRRI